MIQIPIRRRGEFQRPKANVIKGFVIDTKSAIRVFDKLVYGQCSIVRLDNRVRNLNKFLKKRFEEN